MLPARGANLDSEAAMGDVQRLRPLRVLLVSRDPRFASMATFLLSRHGFDVVRRRTIPVPGELGGVTGPAVVDLDSFPGLAVQLSARESPTLLVSEKPNGNRLGAHRILPKWGPFDRFVEELEALSAVATAVATVARV
jgi:hypothetical protein